MSSMINVGILGATGSVGQRFIQLLQNHPWFRIEALGASERSVGKIYQEAANWFLDESMPESVKKMIVQPCDPARFANCRLVFSGLDNQIAGEIEDAFAQADIPVISNAKNHRYDKDVPLLIPEVNPDHIKIIDQQRKNRGFKKGFIATNPNCSVIGMALALKPLQDAFGIKKVFVSTLQAISGAGYPGLSGLDMIANVIPYIGSEEEKMETESKKIFNADIIVSAHCNRVFVQDGHLECVSVEFEKKPWKNEAEMIQNVKKVLKEFSSEPQKLKLPFAPENPIHVFEELNRPQPRLDRMLDKGMACSVGRVRKCNLFDVRFVLLSHNTIRGAAGAAILNAELLHKKGYL